MEIFILDSLLRPIDVVDTFTSMIWTERYAEMGDFELLTLPTPANLKRFVVDTLLMITGSKRVMRVEIVEVTGDSDSVTLKVRGRDLISILEARTALISIPPIAPTFNISGFTPADTMRVMFNSVCVDGNLSSADIIPYLLPGLTLYPPSTIPEPSGTIDWRQKPASLYSALTELGSIYDLGIRLYKDPNTSSLYFNVYTGSDRTTAQSVLPPVIFSPDMENLHNTTEYTSVEKAYNVVRALYVYTDEVTEIETTASVIVYDSDVDPSVSGFDRKVKLLLITSIPDTVSDVVEYLTQAASDELMKSRPIGAFDGEVSQYSNYVYERDYYLGDLVETRGNNGATSYMRVDEYIFVQDGEGERSYPTLITKKFINPGTWLSWKYDVEWSSMGSGEYWSNQ